jgi:hypothetical protein
VCLVFVFGGEATPGPAGGSGGGGKRGGSTGGGSTPRGGSRGKVGLVGLVGRKGGSVGVLGEGGDMEQGGGERRGVDTAHRWGRKVETGLPLHHERQMS